VSGLILASSFAFETNVTRSRAGSLAPRNGFSVITRSSCLAVVIRDVRGRRENNIAAIQERAHIHVTETRDERAQVRHRHSFGVAHIDPADERDSLIHEKRLTK
jgi:PP-loop superfamily ATP-utilizing enzyme